MPRYELLVGRRYLRSARGNRFVSFISVISMAGIAIALALEPAGDFERHQARGFAQVLP